MSESSASTPVKPSASDMVLTINQVRGVYASCIVLDAKRDVNEVHIVASTERKPKQIVRDIETILFVKHATKIDYRMVSMVQIPDEQLLKIPVARPEIQKISEEVTGNQKRIRVEIRGAGRLVVGQANERIDNPTPFQTAANATIDAIEKLIDHSLEFRLEEAQSFRMGTREILIVVVNCLFEDREEVFAGTSFVGARLIDSAARATLDALNRRIHNLAIQAPRESEAIESI